MIASSMSWADPFLLFINKEQIYSDVVNMAIMCGESIKHVMTQSFSALMW